ncbi:MAG TPA: hypothetical protein VF530_20630 [Planctomycetota bacterium]
MRPAGETRYETRDAEARPIVLYGFVLALVLGVAMALSAWISQVLVEEELDAHAATPPSPLRDLRRAHDAPVLQSVPARELLQHRAWEEEQLHGTAWVDPVNRVVRIPIERALEKVLAEGFPVRAREAGR